MKTKQIKDLKQKILKNRRSQSRPDDSDHLKGFSLDTKQLETSMERN